MRTLGGVAVVLVVLAAPAAAAVTLTHGSRSVTIDPRLEVSLHGKKDAAPALTWTAVEEGATARGTSELVDARLTLAADAAGANLSVELRYATDVEVVREALVIELPGEAHAIGRDLAFTAVAAEGLRVDRGTPIALWASGVAVTATGGLIAAEARHAGDRTRITLFLDDERAHPFEPLAACTASDGDNDLKRRWRSRTPRKRGERVTATVRLQLGSAFTPLVVERWGAGARAALVFTDHADRTDVDGLRAVMYGTSDTAAAAYGKGGFVGHGLRLTRTFFGRDGKSTLEDPAAQKLADELVAAGSEVGLHSLTANKDRPSAVEKHLADYRRWTPRTWIDHQPTTNCEALSSRGADDGAHDVRKILVAAGIRWVWSGRDATDRAVVHDLFAAAPGEPAPTFYPLPSEPRLWVFGSSWFYDVPEKLAAALDDAALDRLEAGRGLFVGHVYLSPTARTTKRAVLKKRAIVKIDKGVATLDARIDAALARIAARVKKGTLVTLPVDEAGARLVALESVVVSYAATGAAVVENHGASAIAALTVAVPGADVELLVDGKAPAGTRQEADRTVAWFDVPARGKITVTMRKKAFLDGAGRPTVAVTK